MTSTNGIPYPAWLGLCCRNLASIVFVFSSPCIVEIITFSSRVVPPSVSFITSYGIIGLYISVVLVIGRFLRMTVSNLSHQIIYENMPQVGCGLKKVVSLVSNLGPFLLKGPNTLQRVFGRVSRTANDATQP
jgi:hypothetical protein